mgnify:CR=1 FL=1
MVHSTAPQPRKSVRDQIVQKAEQLLMNGGYHNLSTRKVAQACNISVGNLTYHFPNKALLVKEVMLQVCDRYSKKRITKPLRNNNEPIYNLRKTISWLLDDAVSSETSALFLELWILAKHHDFGTDIIELFYSTAAIWLNESLEVLYPNSTFEKRERAAYFLLTISEGTVALFSRPYKRPVHHDDIINYAASTVVNILE